MLRSALETQLGNAVGIDTKVNAKLLMEIVHSIVPGDMADEIKDIFLKARLATVNDLKMLLECSSFSDLVHELALNWRPQNALLGEESCAPPGIRSALGKVIKAAVPNLPMPQQPGIQPAQGMPGPAGTSGQPRDQLRLLQAAIALSSGKENELRDWLDGFEGNNQGEDDLGPLIEAAGLGEPALRTYPSPKQMKLCEAAAQVGKPLPHTPTIEGLEASKTWQEGRAFAQWTISFIRYAWAGLLHGRIEVASVLNHIEQVARMSANLTNPLPLAERQAMAYDQLVRERAWAAAKRKADLHAFAHLLSGDREELIAAAERQARDGVQSASASAGRSSQRADSQHHCFRNFIGKCDFQDRKKVCSFHHVCPFCAKTGEGCLENHLKGLGLTTIRLRDKRLLEEGRNKGTGKGASASSWNRWSRPEDGSRARSRGADRPHRSRSPRGQGVKHESS